MGLMEVAAIIAALAFAVLTCFAIPVLVAMKNAVVEFKQLTERAQTTVNDLHVVLDQMKELTAEATGRIEEIKPLTQAVSETGRHVRSINSVLGMVTNAVSGSSLWFTGARAAGKFITERITKKGGK